MQAIRRAEGRVKDELYPDMSDGSTLSTTQSRVPEPGLRGRLVLEEKPIAMEHCVRQVMATASTIDVSTRCPLMVVSTRSTPKMADGSPSMPSKSGNIAPRANNGASLIAEATTAWPKKFTVSRIGAKRRRVNYPQLAHAVGKGSSLGTGQTGTLEPLRASRPNDRSTSSRCHSSNRRAKSVTIDSS